MASSDSRDIDPGSNPVVLGSIDEIEKAVGEEVGPGDWLTVEQSRVDGFADATNDHQWIHVDADRAAEGPYRTTIAHGYLTLSLVPYVANQLRRFDNVSRGVNYGLDKVRFPAPVPVGSRIRGRVTIDSCTRIDDNAVQLTSTVTIEVEGSDKPACVAVQVARYYFG